MPIPITCDHCGKSMQVPERMAGRTGKCPGCGHLVKIPAAPPAAGPAPGPARAAVQAPVGRAEGPAACREHKGKPVGKCGGCGQPICLECRKAFGYFCGPACRDATRAQHPPETDLEAKAADRALVAKADALLARGRKLLVFAGLGLGALILVWILLAMRGRVAWEVTDSARLYESAVASGDAVYALTGQGKVVSLDPRSGAVRWAADAGGNEAAADRMVFAWNAELRPAAGRLLCIAGETVTAFDPATGKTAWQHRAPGSGRFGRFRSGTSGLAASDSAIALACDTSIVCLDPSTGKARWTTDLKDLSPSLVGLQGPHVYAAGPPGTVACLSAKDGTVAWTWTMDAEFRKGAPRGLEQLLPRADGVVAATARLAFRLDAKGALRWSAESGPYEDDLVGTTLAEVGNRLFFAGHFKGVMLEAASGRVLWRIAVGNSPRLEWTDGRTLLLTADGPGGPAFQKIEGGPAGMAKYAGSLQGGISMGTGRSMAAFDADTGNSRWSHPAGDGVFVGDGVAYTAGQEGKVALLEPTIEGKFKTLLFAVAVDLATGEPRWRWERLHASGSAVLSARHLLLLGSVAGEKPKDPAVGFVLALDR